MIVQTDDDVAVLFGSAGNVNARARDDGGGHEHQRERSRLEMD
jgi:hypothetical protein